MRLFFFKVSLAFKYSFDILMGNQERHIDRYTKHCIGMFSEVLNGYDISEIEKNKLEDVLVYSAATFATISSSVYSWFPNTYNRIRIDIFEACKRKALWRFRNA